VRQVERALPLAHAQAAVDLFDRTTFYYVCLAILAAFLMLCRRLMRSRFGMAVRGARINERRMKALGFSPYRYKLTAFVISGAGAGLSGALLANAAEFVGPAYMSWQRSGELIVMVVLGGMGTLFGPVAPVNVPIAVSPAGNGTTFAVPAEFVANTTLRDVT